MDYFNCSFNNFDQYADAARHWDIDFIQLDQGEFRAHLSQLTSGNFQFGRTALNRRMNQRGSSPKRYWSFAILESPNVPLIWRGQQLAPNELMIYPPDAEIESVSQKDFSVLIYSVSEDAIRRTGELIGIPQIADLIKTSDRIACKPSALANLRRRLFTINQALFDTGIKPDHQFINDALEYDIPKSVLTTLATHQNKSTASPPSRLKNLALKQALACIEMSAEDNLTVKGLCQMTGVSDRTLQYAFRERFGITPKAYIRTFRLNMVRRMLVQADPGTTRINDVANQWGFWHMGQFAVDYRKMFNELPSDTLRKVRI